MHYTHLFEKPLAFSSNSVVKHIKDVFFRLTRITALLPLNHSSMVPVSLYFSPFHLLLVPDVSRQERWWWNLRYDWHSKENHASQRYKTSPVGSEFSRQYLWLKHFLFLRLRVAVPTRSGACVHFSLEREQEPIGSRSRRRSRAEPLRRSLECKYRDAMFGECRIARCSLQAPVSWSQSRIFKLAVF